MIYLLDQNLFVVNGYLGESTIQMDINYFDTYTPMAKFTSIRLPRAWASISNLFVYQINVKTVFLNVKLDEEMYIEQLEGLVMHGQKKKFTNQLSHYMD